MVRAFLLTAAVLMPVGAIAQTFDERGYKIEYNEPEQVSPADSLIKINIDGWGTSWSNQHLMVRAKGSHFRDVYVAYSQINKSGYFGEAAFSELIKTHVFSDDTLRSRIQRHRFFSKQAYELGTYGSVENGSADFKYMMISTKLKDDPITCAYFAANWRNFASNGFLCSAPNLPPLTEATVETFLKSIGFKDELRPVAGTLPGANGLKG